MASSKVDIMSLYLANNALLFETEALAEISYTSSEDWRQFAIRLYRIPFNSLFGPRIREFWISFTGKIETCRSLIGLMSSLYQPVKQYPNRCYIPHTKLGNRDHGK